MNKTPLIGSILTNLRQMANQNQELSEIARKNLDSNVELWKAESKYIKLEPGETIVLKFNLEKIIHV
jgi:hypothetical protein